MDYMLTFQTACLSYLNGSCWDHDFFGKDLLSLIHYALSATAKDASCDTAMELKEVVGGTHDRIRSLIGDVPVANGYYNISIGYLLLPESFNHAGLLLLGIPIILLHVQELFGHVSCGA